MLLNNFYKIIGKQHVEGFIKAAVTINPKHEIFQGHFPNQPVVPGVCMMQIAKELIEESTRKKLLIHESSQIKFLQLVVPDENDVIEIDIQYKCEDNIYPVNISFKKNDAVVFKMIAKLKIVE